MKIETTALPGVLLVTPKVFEDARGFFLESYNQRTFAEAGIATLFVQDNHSKSCRHTLRGLHYQVPPRAQAKLVRVTAGEVFDVVVDLRPDSPAFARWAGFTPDAVKRQMLYVPIGFAHGFCVLTDSAEILYKTSDFYSPEHERALSWNDPDIAISWPIAEPILSERDRRARPFADLRRGL